MNIETLKLLKQGLEDNFDRVEKHFNMVLYRSEKSSDGCWFYDVDFKSKTDCGSHGCLLGHAPLLGVDELEPVVSDYDYVGLDFEIYCRRVFNIKPSTSIWCYLFAGSWEHHDSTLQGAINRLENVISGKVTVANAKEFLPWVYCPS